MVVVQHSRVTIMVSGSPYLNDEKLYYILEIICKL